MRTILIAATLLSGTAAMAQTQIKQMTKEEAQARVQGGPPAAWATTGKPNPESDLLVQRLIDWGHATKEPRAFIMAARIVAMRTNRSSKLGGNVEEGPLIRALFDQAVTYANGDADILIEIEELRSNYG